MYETAAPTFEFVTILQIIERCFSLKVGYTSLHIFKIFVCTTQIVFSKSTMASHTKCMFSAKCNSCRIAIQWFHVNRYSDIPYTKIQPYISRVQKFCVFA